MRSPDFSKPGWIMVAVWLFGGIALLCYGYLLGLLFIAIAAFRAWITENEKLNPEGS